MATSAQAIKRIFDAYPDSELVDGMEDASKRGIGYVVIVFDVSDPDEQLADYGGEIMKTIDAQED